MAVAAKYTRFLLDEFDFSGDSNALTVALTVNPLQDTGFQEEAETYIAGLATHILTQGGYYSGKGAGYIEQEINARLGTATAVYAAALFGTNTAACPAYVTKQTWGQQVNLEMPVDGLITLSSEWPASSGFVRGLRIYSGTLSATGGQTAVDFGAAGSAGGMAYVFVQAITGTATGATIDIESSSTEGGVYASEGTATFSAVGAQAVALSGAIDRWLRINVTSLGGATDFTVVVIGCISGVSY